MADLISPRRNEQIVENNGFPTLRLIEYLEKNTLNTNEHTIQISNIKDLIVQTVNTQTGEVATGTTTIPSDDSIPQNTEGNEYMTRNITPTNATNILRIEVVCHLAHNSANTIMAGALFQDSNSNAIAVGIGAKANVANTVGIVNFTYNMVAGTTSSTVFNLRGGCNSAGTTTFNGVSGTRRYGGILTSSITITEIKA